MNQQVPAGWYPDPEYAGHLRYWDGSRWTGHRSPHPAASPAAGHAAGPAHPGPYGGFPVVVAQPADTLSTLGIVFGGIAFLFFPIVFGPAGLVLSGIGLSKHERLAPVALGVSAAGMVVGFILGALLRY